MRALRTQPVAVVVALATLVEAFIGLAMALDWIEPELGGAATLVVTATIGLVKRLVTPVEKVARVLDKPVELTNEILGKVKL